VELFEIDPCEHDGGWITDPVCGMRVPAEQASERRVHDGREIAFCSARCAEIFSRSPQRFP
jgi:YHS domain-containing protein